MRIAIALLAGCYALPPPPLLPPHVDTAPNSIGTNTAMVIVGGATDISGRGFGAALRFEHQDTARTTFGAELSGGSVARGNIGGKGGDVIERSHALFGLRGYGRYSVSDHFATDDNDGDVIVHTSFADIARFH